jgi:hypothetical protein
MWVEEAERRERDWDARGNAGRSAREIPGAARSKLK